MLTGLSFFARNMRNLALVLGVPAALVFVYANFIQKPSRDPVVYASRGDEALSQARDKAQATLPEFLDRLRRPQADENTFGIKFKLEPRHAVGPKPAGSPPQPDEFIWAKNPNLQANGKVILAFLDGTPRTTGFSRGQPVSVRLTDIVDWGYRKGGVMQGHFSTRILISSLSVTEQEKAKRLMGWN